MAPLYGSISISNSNSNCDCTNLTFQSPPNGQLVPLLFMPTMQSLSLNIVLLSLLDVLVDLELHGRWLQLHLLRLLTVLFLDTVRRENDIDEHANDQDKAHNGEDTELLLEDKQVDHQGASCLEIKDW